MFLIYERSCYQNISTFPTSGGFYKPPSVLSVIERPDIFRTLSVMLTRATLPRIHIHKEIVPEKESDPTKGNII